MIAPRVAIVVVSVTNIVISVVSNVAINLNMITIVVTNVSINKVLLQLNFEGSKR